MVCKHLSPLEQELIASRIPETYRGKAWGQGTREWVYFDCVLDLESLQQRFQFDDCVEVHQNLDPKSGQESGFYCKSCLDGIMGKLKGEVVFK
ncbi:MAG: hypothetical protein KDE26_08885 [Bacteroidetes bacterium]|nr:hypothetical protein [Bacteroidota bacterium]